MQCGILLSPKEVSFREKLTPGGHFIPEWQQFPGGNALGVLREILLSPKEVSSREKPTPGGHFVPKWLRFPGENAMRAPREILLSPKEVSFREEPSLGGHFVPEWLRFPGGNALGVPGEILLSPKEVSFREKPTPGALCPRMAAVFGRTRTLAIPLPRTLPGTFLAPRGMGICIVGEIFFVEQMHLKKKIVTFGQILQKIYLNIF